jgi:type VI secretion system protein ImpG
MSDPIEAFYERELAFLEETTRPFSERYPANAKNLVPETGRSIDPHLERLIEGCALLTGRIRHKVDSEFPELIESLLQILYPHLSLIIPSMAIAQARPPGGADLRSGWHLDRGTLIQSSAFGPRAERFQYSVGYPVTAWPIELRSATWEAAPFDIGMQPPRGSAALLRLHFTTKDGLSWDDLTLDRLRLYLTGERQFTTDLYESLFNRCIGVAFRPADPDLGAAPVRMEVDMCVSQVGFEVTDGLLPLPPESFVGYGLLMELLSFPQKFLFADLAGWEQVRGRGWGPEIEVLLFFSQSQHNLERSLSAQNLLLGCTPVVNVFPQSAEPVDNDHHRTMYRVVPSCSQPRSMEVFRIESVRTIDAETGKVRELLPFYASRFGQSEEPRAYYHISRKDSEIEEIPGTEVYLAIVDPEFQPSRPSTDVLDVQAWCTNRDHSSRFQQAGDRLSPRGRGAGWLELLHKPTAPLRRTLRRGAYWRILGQNSLNHVSLIDVHGGVQALRELLSLCDFTGPTTQQLAAVNQQILDGIKSVRSRPMLARVRGSSARSAHCRGMEVDMEFDEEKYTGTGVLLVASVLERFLALYTGVNSFTRLKAKTAQAEGYLKVWPPRAGAERLP